MTTWQVDAGTFLILEGAVVGAVVLARALVVRLIAPDTVPAVIRGRVRLGNRITPALAALAALFLSCGGVLLVLGR